MRIAIPAAVVLAVACGAALAQMYRWVDKDGKTHYTQEPPPPDAKSVEKRPLGGGTATGTSGAMSHGDLPYASQTAARNYPVILYTTPDCGAPCDQARAVLVRRVVPFKEISVQRQQDVENFKAAGGTQVPFLIVGSQKQAGFLEETYAAILDTAGYPTSGPRLSLEQLRTMDAPAAASPPQGGPADEGPAK
jgi:glutaredoxin